MVKKSAAAPVVAPLSVEALANAADLYVRVSTTEQAEEGYSVGEQEERGRAWCAAYGIAINAVHVDAGYSGATLDRPGIKNLIRDVRRGNCKKVIVWKLDRLSRSQKDTLVLLEDVFLANGCDFVSIMESFDTSTPFGRCIVGILAAFAQMERENIKARMMMGKQAGVKEGRYFSGVTPYGYRYELQADGRRALVVDPVASCVVKDLYAAYDSGKSLSAAARMVREKYGIDSGRDPAYTCSHFSGLLRNPVYAGRVRLKDKEYPGKHEAIVSPELWKRVNDRLEMNKKEYKRVYGKSDGLLSGLLFCGDCGARMALRKWGGTKEKPKRKYICHSVSRANKLMIRSDNCSNRKNLLAEELDALVLEEIKKLSVDPAALDALIAEGREDSGPDLGAVQERLAETEKQINRLLTLYQSGIVELEEIQGRLADLKEAREAAQACLEEAEKESSGKLPKADALAALGSLAPVVDSGDAEALFSLVHALIRKVEVLNEEIKIYWAFC